MDERDTARARRHDVLLVTSTFPRHARDGTGRFLLDLVQALPQRISVLAPDDPASHDAPPPAPGVTPIRFPNHGLFFGEGAVANLRGGRCSRAAAAATLLRMTTATGSAARRARVVWSHWAVPAGALGALCRRVLGVPHVLSLHGGDVWLLESRRWGPGLARRIASRCDAVLAPTELLAERFERISGRRPEVLGTGVPDLARRHVPRADPPRVGTLCRLAPGKGLRGLVGAAAALRGELRLAGDGPLRAGLAALASRRPNVQLDGTRLDEDKARWLARLSVFAAPHGATPWGQPEGLPVSVLEALSAGVPVVAHPETCPGGPLVHEHNALLVPQGRPELVVAAANRLLHDDGLRERLARGARASARDYLHEHVLPRWSAILADPSRAGLC